MVQQRWRLNAEEMAQSSGRSARIWPPSELRAPTSPATTTHDASWALPRSRLHSATPTSSQAPTARLNRVPVSRWPAPRTTSHRYIQIIGATAHRRPTTWQNPCAALPEPTPQPHANQRSNGPSKENHVPRPAARHVPTRQAPLNQQRLTARSSQ